MEADRHALNTDAFTSRLLKRDVFGGGPRQVHATLIFFVVEACYEAGVVPKLDVKTIHELFGEVRGVVVVGTLDEFWRSQMWAPASKKIVANSCENCPPVTRSLQILARKAVTRAAVEAITVLRQEEIQKAWIFCE